MPSSDEQTRRHLDYVSRRNIRGFSLAEMIVVAAIVGVLYVVAPITVAGIHAGMSKLSKLAEKHNTEVNKQLESALQVSEEPTRLQTVEQVHAYPQPLLAHVQIYPQPAIEAVQTKPQPVSEAEQIFPQLTIHHVQVLAQSDSGAASEIADVGYCSGLATVAKANVHSWSLCVDR